MARVVLNVHSLEERNKLSAAFTALNQAVDATDGAEFTMSERDDKYLILIQNASTSAKTVTILHGNGIQGVCDLQETVAASSYVFVAIDSGRFKNVSGEDKGKVIIKGASADIKIAVFKLP
jgi:hypothetical protein